MLLEEVWYSPIGKPAVVVKLAFAIVSYYSRSVIASVVIIIVVVKIVIVVIIRYCKRKCKVKNDSNAGCRNYLLNPYEHAVLVVEYRQTLQTQSDVKEHWHNAMLEFSNQRVRMFIVFLTFNHNKNQSFVVH